jgi:integrase
LVEPKSRPPRRTIDIDAATVAALRAHRDRQAFSRKKADDLWAELDLVCATRGGGMLNPHNVLRNFAAILERAGVPNITDHGIRHTHATTLLLAGVPITLVSRRLGHAKVSITLDTYSHLLPAQETLASATIGSALFA